MPAVAKPKETDEAKVKAEREAEEAAERAWLELVERATADEESIAARQIRRAIALEAQIDKLRGSVNKNRTFLRLMNDNEELSEDQSEFVDVFYAEKERGERRTDAEAAATNRARKLARKAND